VIPPAIFFYYSTLFDSRFKTLQQNLIFQFPLYWYSSPSLLKKWIDEVIIYGWAYGSKGKRIFYNRKLGLAISAGVKKGEFTSMGKNKHTLTQMLTPFKSLCA
ncbi:NAD(P)H-dependent oxidoreductase, partial [Streptococcus gallolyticus]|uniref:NAD(P)H-dependent oxidoreductase n=1 Tax=Streptococcus gallolyticus TaxID=315405 RepID=UPI002096C6F2